MTDVALPPVLLLRPAFSGTLAAARCMGARGVRVVVADESLFAPTRWSRYVSRRVRTPPHADSEAVLAWLLESGSREPGCVLYPSCDDQAWLFALHRAELGRHFHLYSPPVVTLNRLLDKRQLYALAREVGVATPVTSYPADHHEAVLLAHAMRYPIVVKPRTQVLSLTGSKGAVVDRAEDLAACFRRHLHGSRYHPILAAHLPEATQLMLQEYAAHSTAIYTVSGFVDRTGRLFAARASNKVLQRPRGLGVGVCFEAAPLAPEQHAGVERLCRAAGYYGAFDVEFLDVGGHRLLIDFNPRFYNQMAFEVARGLPTPWLAYLGALGRDAELAEVVRDSWSYPETPDAVYCDRIAAQQLLVWQVLSGTLPFAEERRWRHWHHAHRAFVTDPIDAPGDRAPLIAAAAAQLADALRHPRAFLRKTVLGRST
jgi:predicted ATP-grasp superfamily ATP-dependent carboligase